MPTVKSNHDNWSTPENSPRETSITAHIVKSIAVTMSISEMDILIGTFGAEYSQLDATQRRIQQEFVDAVSALR